MNSCCPGDMEKAMREAMALYELYNIFGRGKVNEETFIALYLHDELPAFIEKQLKGATE